MTIFSNLSCYQKCMNLVCFCISNINESSCCLYNNLDPFNFPFQLCSNINKMYFVHSQCVIVHFTLVCTSTMHKYGALGLDLIDWGDTVALCCISLGHFVCNLHILCFFLSYTASVCSTELSSTLIFNLGSLITFSILMLASSFTLLCCACITPEWLGDKNCSSCCQFALIYGGFSRGGFRF